MNSLNEKKNKISTPMSSGEVYFPVAKKPKPDAEDSSAGGFKFNFL